MGRMLFAAGAATAATTGLPAAMTTALAFAVLPKPAVVAAKLALPLALTLLPFGPSAPLAVRMTVTLAMTVALALAGLGPAFSVLHGWSILRARTIIGRRP